MPEVSQTSSLPLNVYDMGVFGILLLSVVFGVFRGFTREVLSIGGWVGAVLGTTYAFPILKVYFRDWIGNIFFADITTLILLFVTLLVCFSLMIRSVSDKVKGSKLGGVDRSLGLLFGIARGGALLIGLFFASLFIWKTPEKRPPELQQAKTLPLLIQGAEAVVALLPKGMVPQKIIDSFGSTKPSSADDLLKNLARPKAAPQDSSAAQKEEKAYSPANNREMDRLIKNFS